MVSVAFHSDNANDQPAIMRQYLRHVAEIRTGINAQQVVLRSLQFANSEPKGPVYCWAQREITEEHLDPQEVPDVRAEEVWSPIEPAPLNRSTVTRIISSPLKAKNPLLITSYLGRNPAAVDELVKFVDLLAVPVFQSCLSYVNLPCDHPMHVGVAFGGNNPLVEEAECILVIDSDIPWIPLLTKPQASAEIFHIDCDPLKERMAFHACPALVRAKADSALALEQLCDHASTLSLPTSSIEARRASLVEKKASLTASLRALEAPEEGNPEIMTAPLIVATYRRLIAAQKLKSLVCNEAISNYPHVWNHVSPGAGEVMSSGASSLGWALGAAIGAQMAGAVHAELRKDIVTVVVGDGSFLFGVPSASYWIARRYETPFLTIIFNNGGWKSPRLSMLGVHPSGLGVAASAGDLNISFGPTDDLNPDYGGIAAAAGGAWAKKVKTASELEEAMKEAVRQVVEEKRSAVLDCWLTRF
ncbi:hypothetical protein JCM5296_000300 [Sporobolomyces johnsonii]